jgi:hypothetical protein
MKKSYWKQRAQEARDRAEVANSQASALRLQVAELTHELEDKRKNWAPIKIKHPYTPRDATCMYCDDPAEDPRHDDGAAA